MKSKKPTRRQKIIMYQKLHLDPNEWFVARWNSASDYITLVNRFTGGIVQKLNPERILDHSQ